MDKITLPLGIFAALCTTVIGMFTLYSEEMAIPAKADIAGLEQIVSARVAPARVGVSTLTNKQGLDLCLVALRTMNSLQMRYLSETSRSQLPTFCVQLSDAVTASAPTNSYAWAVGALAAAKLEDWPGFNNRLVLSQVTGPSEQWVAGTRADLAFKNFERMDEAAVAANRDDIKLMIQSIPGSHALARHYLKRADLREHIEAAINEMPALNQRRFVSVVRAASQPG